jgi:hypothetical protein
MLVVAFYTRRTPYEEEIKNLEASCFKHELDYHFEGYDGRGVWVHNCAIKPEFIFDMLKLYPKDNLLYVDADALFIQKPTLINKIEEEGKIDIAAYIMKGGKLLSGTVFFRNNARVQALVNEWVKLQRHEPNKWDQETLHLTIVHHGPRLGIEFDKLPSEYCKIFDKDWGDPVIQHNQKSREYRHLVKESIMCGVPAQIFNQRVTIHGDGSFTLPRRHREAEKFMDERYQRIQGERRWVKVAMPPKNMSELEQIFSGKKCYIIGKGPSLDDLSNQAFEDKEAPIIALNEAIHKLESLEIPNPIYVLQQDMGLRDNCRPKRGKLFVSVHAKHWYADFHDKYVYDPEKLAVQRTQLAVICAIELAKKYGASAFDLLCFDACVNKRTAYATCIGHPSTSGGNPNRFLKHRKHIENHIQGYKVNWVIPTSTPSTTYVDKPEKQSKHLEEHHEHDHEESLKSKLDKLD